MNNDLLAVPEACRLALVAIETNPLELPIEIRAHLRTCPACAEARVLWLAQEDAPHALAPAGYFEKLPSRVLRKLPARVSPIHQAHPVLWSAAAILAIAVGIGGFMAGRANRTPMVEASIPAPAATTSIIIPDAPFHGEDELTSQLSALSPQEAEALARKLPVETAPQPSSTPQNR